MSCEISDIKRKYLLLNRWVEEETAKRLHDNALQWDQARLNSVKAPRAGAWLNGVPSSSGNTKLSREEFQSRVGRRLQTSRKKSDHLYKC